MFTILAVTAALACPTAVESSIRAVPGYADLQRPMSCNYVGGIAGASAWAFRHGGIAHWYIGQALVSGRRCGRFTCYRARILAFAGNRS